MAQKIGQIGIGALGLPIAVNLIKAGHEVIGYRRSNTEEFTSAGGTKATSPRKVAEDSDDVVIMCLPHFDAFEDVVNGDDGLLAGTREGQIVLELSTYSENDKLKARDMLAERGVRLVEGEVSGIPQMVEQRKGVVLIGGEPADCQAVEEVIKGFTDIFHVLGPFGSALKVKLIANSMVTIHIAAAAEAMNFAEKAGIDLDTLIKVLGPGAGSSVQFNVRAPWMRDRKWLPASGTIDMLVKYFKFIDEMADSADAATPLLNAAKELYIRGQEMGIGDHDTAAMFEVLRTSKRS